MKALWKIMALAAVMAAASQTIGCGIGGCGVAPADGPNANDGLVTFDSVAIGSSQPLTIPFQDSADADETITGASLSGADADAFEVDTAFPLAVPAGTQVMIGIRFSPKHVGPASAELALQTANMGPSPVQLEGTGTVE